jgi:hypothetical protein
MGPHLGVGALHHLVYHVQRVHRLVRAIGVVIVCLRLQAYHQNMWYHHTVARAGSPYGSHNGKAGLVVMQIDNICWDRFSTR